MNRWTLKKRWYTPKQWIMRRVTSALLVVTMLFGPGFPFAAFAAPDSFVGDAAIYLGAPAERVRPKILFLIDNSRATEDPASGQKMFDDAPSQISSLLLSMITSNAPEALASSLPKRLFRLLVDLIFGLIASGAFLLVSATCN